MRQYHNIILNWYWILFALLNIFLGGFFSLSLSVGSCLLFRWSMITFLEFPCIILFLTVLALKQSALDTCSIWILLHLLCYIWGYDKKQKPIHLYELNDGIKFCGPKRTKLHFFMTLSYSTFYSQHLEQCLACTKGLINTSEWIIQPKRLENKFKGNIFSC